MLLPTLDALAPIKRPRGRSRKRLAKLHADKAYDVAALRRALRRRGIVPRIARRGIRPSETLDAIAGWWSVLAQGSISFAACAFGMSAALTSIWRSCISGARSFFGISSSMSFVS